MIVDETMVNKTNNRKMETNTINHRIHPHNKALQVRFLKSLQALLGNAPLPKTSAFRTTTTATAARNIYTTITTAGTGAVKLLYQYKYFRLAVSAEDSSPLPFAPTYDTAVRVSFVRFVFPHDR